MVKQIKLTQNQMTVVDDIDADLSKYKWQAQWNKHINNFYAKRGVIGLFKRHEMLHVVILERKLGRKLIKGELVDHVDRNPLNNIRDNLRLSNRSLSGINRRKPSHNKTGYIGTSIAKKSNKISSYIGVNGRTVHLGVFTNNHNGLIEAAQIRDIAAIYFFGEYAELNFPENVAYYKQKIDTTKYRWMKNDG